MNDAKIVRVVRMHFRTEGVAIFLAIFEANKQSIRNFPGCTHLELLTDVKDPLLYTTLSHWDSEDSLNQYRQSELFAGVWSRVKLLFSKQPDAFSLVKFIEL
jgi:heme-degrading monooxygenase HmoA